MSNVNNNAANIKRKIAAIFAGTMLVIPAAMPASAAVPNTHGQHLTGGEQSTLLLATKGKGKAPAKGADSKGKAPAKGADSKGKETVKGGHSTGKSPSKKETHQKGEARRHQDQNVNPAFKKYKEHGGKLSKDAWQKHGQPKK